MHDDRYQIPNYPDMIVIPFRIPPGMIAPPSRQPIQSRPDRVPADEPAGTLPVEWPDGRAPPVQTARDTLTASASGRAPPAVELVVAAVIESVANDPESKRSPGPRGRMIIEGTRSGVAIRIILGGDGKTIVTAFPTNLPVRR